MSNKTLHELDSQEGQLVSRLLDLPRKILSHDDLEGLQQLILYELAHDDSFGFSKASYLIDNPEFNCLKGVAGYDKNECAVAGVNPWENPRGFIDSMSQAKFHQHVSSFLNHSLCKAHDKDPEADAIQELSKNLGMQNSSFVTWRMRHGNHGILLFEAPANAHHKNPELLHHFVALLSLC
jgi:hypothetical protein